MRSASHRETMPAMALARRGISRMKLRTSLQDLRPADRRPLGIECKGTPNGTSLSARGPSPGIATCASQPAASTAGSRSSRHCWAPPSSLYWSMKRTLMRLPCGRVVAANRFLTRASRNQKGERDRWGMIAWKRKPLAYARGSESGSRIFRHVRHESHDAGTDGRGSNGLRTASASTNR